MQNHNTYYNTYYPTLWLPLRMRSFVIQNYLRSRSLTPKTKKSLPAAYIRNSSLLNMYFLENSTNLLKLNSWLFFTKKLYYISFLKYNSMSPIFLVVRNQHTVISNLLKSYTYWVLNSGIFFFQTLPLKSQITGLLKTKKTLPLTFLDPQAILKFAFHQTTYNTWIFYLLNLLTINSPPHITNYNLKTSYILLPKNFMLFNFINLFYFRVHHF